MCSEVGWKHRETIKTLEEKRKVKSEAYWAKKKEMIQVRFPPLPAWCSRRPALRYQHHLAP